MRRTGYQAQPQTFTSKANAFARARQVEVTGGSAAPWEFNSVDHGDKAAALSEDGRLKAPGIGVLAIASLSARHGENVAELTPSSRHNASTDCPPSTRLSNSMTWLLENSTFQAELYLNEKIPLLIAAIGQADYHSGWLFVNFPVVK